MFGWLKKKRVPITLQATKGWNWVYSPRTDKVPGTVQKHYRNVLDAMYKDNEARIIQLQALIYRFRWQPPTTLSEAIEFVNYFDYND